MDPIVEITEKGNLASATQKGSLMQPLTHCWRGTLGTKLKPQVWGALFCIETGRKLL